jgi:anti-anti-sigma factor
MKHHLDSNAGTLTVTWPGDVLSSNVETLRQQTVALLESDVVNKAKWSVLKLDLTGAKMVDSAGLNLIVSIIKLAKARGGAVRATVGNPNVYRTFIFTRLDKQLQLAQAA